MDVSKRKSGKRARAGEIMERQRQVSAAFNAGRIGQRVRVLVDRAEAGSYIGRTEFDSPEVDPEVFIHSDRPLNIGEFHDFTVTSADDYDLHVI